MATFATTKLDITIREGAFNEVYLSFTDANGDPYDMTGWTAEGMVRQTFDAASPALTFTPDYTSIASGVIILTADRTAVASMPAGSYANDQDREDSGYGDWDATVIDTAGTGNYYRVAEGNVTLSREATK